jgi:hypothetical protein
LFSGKFGLCRKAFSFPHGPIAWIVQDVGGVCFDFILCHAATAPCSANEPQPTIKISVVRRLLATAPIKPNASVLILATEPVVHAIDLSKVCDAWI